MTGSRRRRKPFTRGACGLLLLLSGLLGFQESARASVACGYFAHASGCVLTAVQFPELRVRYRIPVFGCERVVLAGFLVPPEGGYAFVGLDHRLDFETSAGGAGDEAAPEAEEERLKAVVVDLRQGRVTRTLPFNARVWAYSPARKLLAAAEKSTIEVYDPVVQGTHARFEVPIAVQALQFSDDGSILYATHWAFSLFPTLNPTALSVLDVDSSRTVGMLQLVEDREPYTLIKPAGLARAYFGASSHYGPGASQRGLLVVDLDALTIAGRLELPGFLTAPVAAATTSDGRRMFIAHGPGDGRNMDIAIVAVPEDRVERIVPTGLDLIFPLAMSPGDDWLVAVASGSSPGRRVLALWNPDFLGEPTMKELAHLGTGPQLVAGSCPELKPCFADCNADGSVSIDEIVHAVNVALGTMNPLRCLAADQTGDGAVTVDELVRAVGDLLSGCDG
ncbi:MAG: hypothetical protein KatS3mg077_3220 [Candidatus Binatia bacterium]|nr:MAG: hypothetical protein KatS3mg077_3220 [Candidatus Binatia bacterium]